jgi:hypothetical protein
VESVSELNKQKVRLFVDAVLNAGRLDLIDELIAADFLGHVRCVGRAVIGPEGVRQLVSSHRRTHPGLQVTIADLVAEDDRVVVRWRASEMPVGVGFTGRESAPYSEGLSIIRLLAGRQVDSRTECAGSASPARTTPASH